MELKVRVEEEVELPECLLESLDQQKLLAQILWQRGIRSKEQLKAFLNPKYYQPSQPESWPGIKEAVQLLIQTVEAGERIVVYGDYDVDGVSSTAILYSLLKKVGAEVEYHLPDRFKEGYGLNEGVIRDLAARGVDLILSCDCGISNHQEVALAQKLGLKVLITDHHQLPELLPSAEVIVSTKLLAPEQGAYYLPGAGVAYYLARALLAHYDREEEAEEFLDLLALAIVADVVPLKEENRYFLQLGLEALKRTQRVGLKELYRMLELDLNNLSAEDIGFQITPRLNAAGRLDSAELALKLLLSTSAKEARELAVQIEGLNEERKEIGAQIYEEAVALLAEQEEQSSIVLYRADWHQGVLGIAASRLCEKFQQPVLLLCQKEGGKEIVASARSIPEVHIYEALEECEEFLSGFGGHAGAAGLSLKREQLTAFIKTLQFVLAKQMSQLGAVQEVEVEASLDFKDLDLALYRDLELLAPFGEANARPTFLSTQVEASWQQNTQDGKHKRLVLRQQGEEFPAIWWWGGEEELAAEFDLLYSLTLNRWQGKEELQLEVKQLINQEAPCSQEAKQVEKVILELEDYRNWQHLGESLPELEAALYFYEGPQPPQEIENINRYQVKKTEVLFLLSCPPTLKVLRKLLEKTEAQRLILAYSELELKPLRSFLKELAGLIKYILREQEGLTSIRDLAAATAQSEQTISCALKYLQEQGLIELKFGLGDKIILSEDRAVKQPRNSQQKRLKALFSESRAFKNYMLNQELIKIQTLI